TPRYGRLLGKALADADYVIAVSGEIAARAESVGAAPERVKIVPGGVPDMFTTASTHEIARRKLGLADDERWVVWVGGLVPVKQPEHVVDAFSTLALRRPDA